MKNHLNKLTYFFALILLFACNQEAEVNTVDGSNVDTIPTSITKKTQALILTQAFEFDSSNKDSIQGDYVAQKRITIPQDLATQNKWIMFEGPVLENDLVAYRYYADSRHRFDIYGKTVPDLVMDTISWKYHDIMDWGSDILKVGNSLGIGSPAIWYQDSLYTLSGCDKKTIEIIENSDEVSIIRTTFEGLKIAQETFDLVQYWRIEAGQPWSEIHLKLNKGSLPEGMTFATGIVKHLPEIIQGETDEYFYAMNWGVQSFHKENMGMAIIAAKTYEPEHVEDALSHAYQFKNANNEVRYRFLSAWERDNNKVRNGEDFKKLVEKSAE
jgi:hypothetical protein